MLALQVLGVFALLSILAVGGGTAVLPEMKALTVNRFHWLTPEQFGQIYSLGQLAPGPNMLMVSVRVTGTPRRNAPKLSSSGSTTLPFDFDIFCPRSSRMRACR